MTEATRKPSRWSQHLADSASRALVPALVIGDSGLVIGEDQEEPSTNHPPPITNHQIDCPVCHRPMDRRRCWRDHIAVCPCGRSTESAFLTVCRPCEILACQAAGEPY